MAESETHRVNTQARAEVAARGPRTASQAALRRYLAAAAYDEARAEEEAAERRDEEATREHPTATGEPGAGNR
jgi:hypothetical protein